MELQKSRSVIIKKYGGYEQISVENYELPNLDENIEVKVDYGGLNFADLYTRQGLMMDRKLPLVLGLECTGTIIAVGVEDTELKVGQRVICYDYKGGMHRDIVRVSPKKCYPLPEFIESKIGVAIFVNYLTAYFALIELGHLKENENVLILSCAGGVGCAATQLAKTIKNVKVFGTGSAEKEFEAIKNGIDVFFSKESFQAKIEDINFDLIIANEAGPVFTFLQNRLSPLGRIVLIGANNIITNEKKLGIFTLLKAWWTTKYISPESLIVNSRVVAGLHLGILTEMELEKVKIALNHIFDLYKMGKIIPKIHSTWPMSKIIEATKVLGERKNVGKVLVYMQET